MSLFRNRNSKKSGLLDAEKAVYKSTEEGAVRNNLISFKQEKYYFQQVKYIKYLN